MLVASALRAALVSALLPNLIHGASASKQASGLGSGAPTPTVSYATVSNDGHLTTYREIPTLPPSIDLTAPVLPNINDPKAVNAQTVCPGYKASAVVPTQYGFTALLSLCGKACNVYGTDVDTLNLTVQYQSADRLSVNIEPQYITSENATQYLISSSYVQQPVLDSTASSTVQAGDLQFTWTNTPSFGFAVVRKSTGDILFDTRGFKIVFENQFLELVTTMPSSYNIEGLGETIHSLRLGNNFTKTIYAADAGDPIDMNIYGSHSFYLDTRYYEVDPTSGNLTYVDTTQSLNQSAEYVSYAHGVYLRNTHGQEILLRADNITWRALGGSFEFYFFPGPTQALVTQQYQAGAIGYPTLQQYFTFGYHQCRWGYQNWSVIEDVVNNMRNFDIPLENMWTDIDYMNQYRDFDNDQNRFGYAEAKTLLGKLHANHQHYIPIVDSAIYHPNEQNASDAYATFTRGMAANAFMKNPDGSLYIGAVWPGFTVFPDWHAPGTQDWWTTEMVNWHQNISFDGIWIDMSEVSSFCVGSCGTGKTHLNPVHPPFTLGDEKGGHPYDYPEGFASTNASEAKSASSASASQASQVSKTATPSTSTPYITTTVTPGVRELNFPPYAINNVQGSLQIHAMSPNATHADGTSDYDIHNLFGHEIINATYNALQKVFPGKRPFIIGRSTFAGSGQYAGHWGGDNASKWYYMYFSIPQALSFSLFGIPMFGVDTCGFNGNTDEELCNRWMQLSAFFPFYRNHNGIGNIPQEPYRWASVITATKTAMAIRYALLPYMYTLFYLSHTTGSTVMRAMSWEFPTDPSLVGADRQFLLGPSLLVTPVLDQGATSVDGVFPGISTGTVWYDWYTQSPVPAKAGVNTTIPAPLGHIPVYVRGGSILPMQQPGYTTYESRQNPWALLVALSMEGGATGQLYLDDGESQAPNATRFVSLTATAGSLFASGIGQYMDMNALQNVTILGVGNMPKSAEFNGMNVTGVAYNATSKVVSITGLQNMTGGGAWNSDWTLTWT